MAITASEKAAVLSGPELNSTLRRSGRRDMQEDYRRPPRKVYMPAALGGALTAPPAPTLGP